MGRTLHESPSELAGRLNRLAGVISAGPRALDNLDLRTVMPPRCARGCPSNAQRRVVINVLRQLGFTYVR